MGSADAVGAAGAGGAGGAGSTIGGRLPEATSPYVWSKAAASASRVPKALQDHLEAVHSLYTHTLFYFAQVYGNLGFQGGSALDAGGGG